MSTLAGRTSVAADDSSTPPRARRWSGAEYDQLVEQGTFRDQRVELINGEIIQMSPMNDLHAFAIKLANFVLLRVFPSDRYTVQIQCPMRLADHSRPEPDLAVIEGPPRTQSVHPATALLIVEVSDSSLKYDQENKAPLYAANEIQELWIVNLNDRCVERYRKPIRYSDGFRYSEMVVISASEALAPLAAPSVEIRVADLLP